MTEIICRIIIIILAVIGGTEVIRIFFDWLLRPDFEGKGILILEMDGKADDTEYLLRSAEEQLGRLGGSGERWILCVPGEDLAGEAEEVIRIFARTHRAVRFCIRDEICEILQKEFANTAGM